MQNNSALAILKKDLTLFATEKITGRILLKLNSGDIAYMEITRAVSSSGGGGGGAPATPDRAEGKEILVSSCIKALKKLGDGRFYGEVVLNLCAGAIVEISVKRKYRSETLDGLFSNQII